ncbi:helix-turn-helix domain-containing protein [Yokenella regensburgei]|uniref:helix-turn-helix domain-containing protein n=1 Tax=Yokenella regensburgei TaxID=158877 RepID=UPI0013762CE8|nr:helix-turn-helix domain-containing protein [Yokenella regensburgei]KAF1367360.1 transcriptional regulator with XRE-family HTH domain [Yokenella regensburgei]
MSEMTLGQRIRQRRKDIGWSQKELSKAAGVTNSSISLWEGDNTAPRGENLHKLSQALQCSPTWILFGDEDKTPGAPRQLDRENQLSDDEIELLQLYRALPESEQKAQKSNMKARLKNFNRLFEEMLEARKRAPKN